MKKSLWVLITICSLAPLSSCGGGASMGPPPPPACVNASATVVCTQSGQVQGTIENNIRAFRGIPYAAPPVGTEATLKIPAGLRSISMKAVVRFVRSHQAGFETVGMALEDRSKLRRLLVSLGGIDAIPAAPPPIAEV